MGWFGSNTRKDEDDEHFPEERQEENNDGLTCKVEVKDVNMNIYELKIDSGDLENIRAGNDSPTYFALCKKDDSDFYLNVNQVVSIKVLK